MNIRPAQKQDCQEVAKIHAKQINTGFLSELGEKFLYSFYSAMTDSENAFLLVAEDNSRIVGFISGCFDLGGFYKEFVKKNKLKILPVLLKKIFNLGTANKIFETIKYSKKEKKDLPSAELISIAVLDEFQGRGLAKELLNGLVDVMKERGILIFKVVVGENLGRANSFYKKNGFVFHSTESVHKNRPSSIYIYNIN